MKYFQVIVFSASVVCLLFSIYLLQKVNEYDDPITGKTPKSLVENVINRPFVIAGDYFIKPNRKQLIHTLAITNFLENDGVGIAFTKFSAEGKILKLAVWMKKTQIGWELIPYLTTYDSDSPFRGKWISAHKKWITDMNIKKAEWEFDSSGIW